MTDIARVFIDLDGYPGAPGINVLHFSQGSSMSWTQGVVDSVCNDVVGMIEANRTYWAPEVTMRVRSSVDIIDVASGQIQNQITPGISLGTISSSGASGKESRASQILVRFESDQWIGGRKLRGRMFLGPMADDVCDNGGYINAAVESNIIDSFVAMTSGLGPRLAVYSRPGGPAKPTGQYADVVNVSVRPTPAILRKRRD